MKLFSCCRLEQYPKQIKESASKKRKKLCKHGRTVSLLLKNMSRRTTSSKHKLIEHEVKKFGYPKVAGTLFSYQELVVATDNFRDDNLLGEGGFGKVYKGYMKSIDQVVAIKRLDLEGKQGNREFFSEVLTLSMVQHPNLVKLTGYCVDGDQRILVYDFMPCGSLENHLFDVGPDEEPLDWNTRMRIALGAAKGLEHLHDFAKPAIIYRDFKASNVLLTDDMESKLSDFGLARLGPTGDQAHVSTRVMGTYGYCAPEYQRTGQLTTKSDVYSFGVVLLELITGRRVIDTDKPTGEQNMISWAAPLVKEKGNFRKLADPLLKGNYPMKNLHQVLAVAAGCLQEDAAVRPLMGDVVSALEFLATGHT